MKPDIGQLVVVGFGNMGGALVERWLARGVITREAVVVYDVAPERAAALGLRTVTDASALSTACDTLLLAVKPQVLGAVAPSLAHLDPSLTLSVLAGTSVEALRNAGVPGQTLVRAMPNTAAKIGASATVLYSESGSAAGNRALAEALFSAVGTCAWVEREALMHAATAVVGSGPAFVYMLAEALADAGVAGGLPRQTAQQLVAAMLSGAGQLLAQEPSAAAALKDAVASPAGTTIAGIEALERYAFRGAAMAAVDAAIARSRGLEAGE